MRKKRSKWKYAALTKTINCPRREYWIANSRGNSKLIANWLCGNGFLVLCLFKPNGCGLFYIYKRKCERFKQNKILFINCCLFCFSSSFVNYKYVLCHPKIFHKSLLVKGSKNYWDNCMNEFILLEWKSKFLLLKWLHCGKDL